MAGRGTLETIWDSAAESSQTKFEYDGGGRLSRVVLGFGTADHTLTQYEYDELGNLIAQYDGNSLMGLTV